MYVCMYNYVHICTYIYIFTFQSVMILKWNNGQKKTVSVRKKST